MVYGAMSMGMMGNFNPSTFIFDPYKMLRGFFLTTWFMQLSMKGKYDV